MITVAEVDSKGRTVRIFHRTPATSWTHAPGERYRYWPRRHREPGWIEMPCACPQSGAGDQGKAGARPSPTPTAVQATSGGA